MRVWEITKTQYKVSDFLLWHKAGNLVLSPSFQRRPVWKKGAKSYLVDTVVRGLPMPIILLGEQKTSLQTYEPKREVVDGQQRLRTVIAFLDGKSPKDYNFSRDDFVIQKNHNPDLADRPFAQLPASVRQQVLDYQFSVHILP